MKCPTKAAARLLHDGSLALSKMEGNGVRVDVPYLDGQIADAERRIAGMTRALRADPVYTEWRKRFGDRTKLGSKEQMAHVIFDCLGYPRRPLPPKPEWEEESDEGLWDEAAFAGIDLPFVKDYFRCEKLKKLKGTYLDGIRREVVNGFVHPSYNLHTVISYRSSANMPNWQNVLARNPELAGIIRRCYIPRKGRHIVESDFATLEVRVAACYTKDRKLIRYIKDPSTDMHRDMAMRMFSLTKDQVGKKTTRDWAKNRFVFPEFYGSVYFQCAPHLWEGVLSGARVEGSDVTILEHLRRNGITELGDCTPGAKSSKTSFVNRVRETEDFLWLETFTDYTEWKKRWYAAYLKNGHVDMFTGFRCAGLFSRNQVLNTAIQGTAFHCELWSIIQIQKALDRYKMDSLLIGQIHDCDDADVPPGELQDYLSLVREIKEEKLAKHFADWVVVPFASESECCPVDEPWTSKTTWTQDDKGVWGPK